MGCCDKIQRATKGVYEAVTGKDRPPSDVMQFRLATCKSCEHRVATNCSKCGCFVMLKIRVASEECPAGKWGKVDQHGEA